MTRLMTIPGVDMTVALATKGAIARVPLRRATEACKLTRAESQPGSARQGSSTRGEIGPWTCPRHTRRRGSGGSARAGATP